MTMDDQMIRIAKKIDEKWKEELQAIEAVAETVEIPEETHQAAWNIIQEYKGQQEKKESKERGKRRRVLMSRIAAVFAVCFVAFNGIALETSDAYRRQFFTLFRNNDEGAVTLQTETEYDLIGDWEDYWYPQWLPEGYALFAAEKKGTYGFMNFQEDGGAGEIIVDEYSKTTSITFDTEHTERKEVKIGTYEGVMFWTENMDWIIVIWPTEDRIVEVTLIEVRDEEIAMKVARGLHHIK